MKRTQGGGSLEFYIDGAAKGNPGPGGIGVVVCRDGRAVKNISYYIGEVTNNVAEYTALIYGLQEALIQKAKSVKVYTDSELLFKQLKGVYKVKDGCLRVLNTQVQHLLSGISDFDIMHIPRESNKGADALANQAVKQDVFSF
jgi:ribonuclease HI